MMSTIEECARFVSLIPFLDDFKIGHTKEAWNASDDFLQLRAGDEEEHAILYAITLIIWIEQLKTTALNRTLWLVEEFQRAKPFRYEANGNDITFWNACTGDGYLKVLIVH